LKLGLSIVFFIGCYRLIRNIGGSCWVSGAKLRHQFKDVWVCNFVFIWRSQISIFGFSTSGISIWFGRLLDFIFFISIEI
jgi:hypothetical protein